MYKKLTYLILASIASLVFTKCSNTKYHPRPKWESSIDSMPSSEVAHLAHGGTRTQL